jgi:hypothetical protein
MRCSYLVFLKLSAFTPTKCLSQNVRIVMQEYVSRLMVFVLHVGRVPTLQEQI